MQNYYFLEYFDLARVIDLFNPKVEKIIMIIDILLYIAAGAGVGLAIGLTGVGGGSLMTPLLILFGFPYNVAIGTDLLYASITKAGGVVSHHKQKSIEWRTVKMLALGSVPASLLTAIVLSQVFTDSSEYEGILTRSLGVMLVLTASVILLNGRLKQKVKVLSPSLKLVQKIRLFFWWVFSWVSLSRSLLWGRALSVLLF